MAPYTSYLRGRAIQTGADWRVRIKVVSPDLEAFPESARFLAQMRETNADGPVKIEMTTENTRITRVDGQTLDLSLKGVDSVDWQEGVVVLDVLRVDLTSPVHLGFDMKIPVKRSITRVA
jgi:hypothetical protein